MADIKSVPAATSGVSASSSTTAWSFGSWVQITSGLSVGLKVIGIQFQESQNNPPLDTTIERVFEIGIGSSGSEVTKLQIPSLVRSDTTAYGHYLPPVNKIWLSEPYLINANTRIAVRVADSTTTAVTYNGIKLIYEENLPPSVVLNSPANSATTSTTPTLSFTGTDPDGDDVRYNLLLDTVNTFDGQSTDITVDATSNSGVKASVSSFSWDHTVASTGINKMLVVCLQMRDATQADIPATEVTYGGINMTLAKAHNGANHVDFFGAEIWILPSPPVGTNSIVVTLTGTVNHASGMAISLFNVKQSTTPNATAQGLTNSYDINDPSITVTTTVDKCIVIDSVYNLTTFGNLTVGANQTVISSALGVNGGGDTAASSRETKATAGDTIMSWTTPGAGAGMDAWISVAVALAPGIPLLNKVSGTDNGFTNTVTGGDTDPFNSGEKIDYQVQAGDALANSTQYYWKVRAKDPSGSNTWGSWSSTRSFTAQAGTTTSDNRLARIKGQATTSNTRNARTKGVATISDNRSARTKGSLTTSDTRSTRTKGIATASDTRNARTKGYLTSFDTRNARTKGVDTIFDTRGVKTKGASTTSDNRNARTKGVATTSDTRNARVKGQITTSDTRNAKIKGWATTSDTRAARTKGVSVNVISDNRDARIKGLDTLSNNRNSRIKGFDIAKYTRNARTKGYLTISDTRAARIKGKSTASDFRNAHIKGSATTSDTRGARLIGAIASYRKAKVKGPEPNYPKFIFVDGKLAIRLFGKFYHKV